IGAPPPALSVGMTITSPCLCRPVTTGMSRSRAKWSSTWMLNRVSSSLRSIRPSPFVPDALLRHLSPLAHQSRVTLIPVVLGAEHPAVLRDCATTLRPRDDVVGLHLRQLEVLPADIADPTLTLVSLPYLIG